MKGRIKPIIKRAMLTALMLGFTIIAKAITIGQLDYTLDEDNMTATVNGLGDDSQSYDDLIIPESIIYNGNTYIVVAIADQAFKNCENFTGIGNLSLPSTLQSIGKEAFYRCHFKCPLTIPDGIVKIEESAFEESAFWGLLTLPNSLKTIEYKAFRYCQLSGELALPETLTKIGDMAFQGCLGLTGILSIPESVTSIGEEAFTYCQFNKLLLHASIEVIVPRTFYVCTELTEVTLPNTITEIQEGAFYGCGKLTGVLRIPDSVKSIGNAAFSHSKFSEIYLGCGLESIGDFALHTGDDEEYKQPDYIECLAINPPTIHGLTFSDNTYQNTCIHVPTKSVEVYKSDNEWGNFKCIQSDGSEIDVESIILDKTTIELTEGDSETITATVLPNDATDKTIAWTSSDASIAAVDANGNVTAVNAGEAIITATAASGVSASCRVNVYSLPAASTTTILSADKLREGSELEGIAEQPKGGNPDGWTYQWIVNNEIVSTSLEFSKVMIMPSGKDKATTTATVIFRATNLSSQGSLYGSFEQTMTVEIYRAPETPKTLLRKGDGTTHTLIAMMNANDSDLNQMGYSFVYGYTDASGQNHICATTSKRYCQIDKQVFNDRSKSKWVYSQWEYPDGSLITSGLRYLDGAADETFNNSDFTGNSTVMLSHSDPDSWITLASGEAIVDIEAESATTINVFTISGINVMTQTVPAGTYSHIKIGKENLPCGVYIITVSSAGQNITKKIIIK